MRRHVSEWMCVLMFFCIHMFFVGTPESVGQTAVGGWGHFLTYHPRVHVLNPQGRAFTVKIHFMKGVIPGWNKKKMPVRVTDPGGKVVKWDVYEVKDTDIVLKVPAGPEGGYTVDVGAKKDGSWTGGNFWVESDLDQSVVWTGIAESKPGDKKNALEKRRPVFQVSVPRMWWFWVPEGTTSFTVKAQRMDRYMSQREDWGFFVYTPRGQRITALWGQPPKTGGDKPYRQEMVRNVEVEPGNDGHFWAISVRYGDSHNISNINFCLDGVPPYIARSPEEWFNPKKGGPPDVLVYEDEPYIQAAYEPKEPKRWPHLQHWSPSPSLGDPDGIEIQGAASLALWNPEGRDLRFMIADYLPRGGFGKEHRQKATIVVNKYGSEKKGKNSTHPVPHFHGHNAPDPAPLPGLEGKGVFKVDVRDARRWWAFTYPATPLAYIGKNGEKRWKRWTFEVGTARNWYFYVPDGTRSFRVRASAQHDTDVMHLQVNAPDRTQALIYGNEGEQRVKVPDGLDGKIWHIRTDVGSATRMITRGSAREVRRPAIYLTLELSGVPGYLAPTWQQWFNPQKPALPLSR